MSQSMTSNKFYAEVRFPRGAAGAWITEHENQSGGDDRSVSDKIGCSAADRLWSGFEEGGGGRQARQSGRGFDRMDEELMEGPERRETANFGQENEILIARRQSIDPGGVDRRVEA